jgi:hypothetical protein
MEVAAMAQTPKITTGSNDRPRNETISQTGGGLPDDSSAQVAVDDVTIERIRNGLLANPRTAGGSSKGRQNVDEVPPGTPGAAENICRRCSGTGRIDGETCPDCAGTGVVTTPVGGG